MNDYGDAKQKNENEKKYENKHVTWLHLSDAHLGNIDGRETERILDKLQQDFKRLQEKYQLHGHEHQGWVEPLGENCRAISAGACYGQMEEEMGYNVTRWTPATGVVECRLRKCDKTGGGWVPLVVFDKTGDEGLWRFKLPLVGTGEEDGGLSNKNINDHNIAIYTKCLAKLGQAENASSLRMEQIGKGSRDPIFYNDEARYLCGRGNDDAALEIIRQAEARGLVDEHIKTMKSKIVNAKKERAAQG